MQLLRCSAISLLFAFVAASVLCRGQGAPGFQDDIVTVSSGLCIQASGASTGKAAPMVQEPCAGIIAEAWSLAPVGSYFHLVSTNSGMCLNIPGSSTNEGVQLVQWPCQGSNTYNDQWDLVQVQGGASPTYHIVSRSSGQCVHISGNSSNSGAAVTQWPCQSASTLNDQFYLNLKGTEVMALNSGQCLEASNSGTTPGTPIVQVPCDESTPLLWSFIAVGSNYHIVSQNSGMCLNVPGSSTSEGVQLVQQPCQAATTYNDQWSLAAVEVGASTYYQLVSVSSGQCVSISGDSSSSGAPVVQWPCQGASTPNGQFYIDISQIAPATLPSTWTSVISLPVTPIAVANLPNGNLLIWSADQQFGFSGDIGDASGRTYYAIFNPSTQTAAEALETNARADLFCPGTAQLPNGNVLVNGGSSSPKTSIFNPSTGTWSADANMNVPRGYEADTLLSTGSVYTMGGSWSGGQNYKNGEVWTSGKGWSILANAPDDNAVGPDPQGIYRGDNHMWLFAQSNGMVFQAGPSSQMNWISTSGSGSITSAGTRGNDPFSINGNAVLYDIGKILKVGGAPAYQHTHATNSAYLIDITGGPNNSVNVRQINGMTYSRAFSSSVVLPTGDVVVVGGQIIAQPFTDTTAVLAPELWNHTSEMFSVLNPMQTPRTYHSTAILLPDARVFVGGGGQCGSCAENHLNAEILSPPYLFDPDGSLAKRPQIQSAPATASLGTSISVTTTGPVASFVLMRLSAITHTVNNDQRRIPLQATLLSNSTYSLAIPSDPGIVLPGYYMLFALNSSGVPSISTTLQIQ